MKPKILRLFICSWGVLLLGAAIAKLVSSIGSARILLEPDPIFRISFQHVFWMVGIIELTIGMVCLFGKRGRLQVGLVAWLATNFALYRLALFWIGRQRPCPCLGNLTGSLHVSPQAADKAMQMILAYLLIGSYMALFLRLRQYRKIAPVVGAMAKLDSAA